MTATELHTKSGLSVSAIRGRFYRFTDTKSGFKRDEPLPDDFVKFVLNGKTEPSQKPKPAKVREPKPRTEPSPGVHDSDEPNRTEPEVKTEPEPISEPEVQTEPGKPFDLGDWIFFHPTANFLFVVAILSGGAFIFASLASKLYGDGFNSFGFVIFFAIGFLADSSGVIYARRYKKSGKFDDAFSVRSLLWFLFAVQVCIEGGNMFFDKPVSFIGVVFVLVRPLAQIIYSEMYLNNNQ